MEESGLGRRINDDPSLGLGQGKKALPQAIEINFFDTFLDVFKFDVAAWLAFGDQEEMVAERRLDDIAHLIRLQGESSLGETRFHKTGLLKPADITALDFGRTLRFFLGEACEVID